MLDFAAAPRSLLENAYFILQAISRTNVFSGGRRDGNDFYRDKIDKCIFASCQRQTITNCDTSVWLLHNYDRISKAFCLQFSSVLLVK